MMQVLRDSAMVRPLVKWFGHWSNVWPWAHKLTKAQQRMMEVRRDDADDAMV